MKKILSIFSLCLALTATASVHTETDSEKTKTYSKTYPLASGDKVLLANKFGDIKINTWDKNEVKVEILISVKSNSDAQAQQLMDGISISDEKSGSDISFKTQFREGNDNNGRNEKQSFRINYTVYIPSRTALSASNSFGDITMGDYSGELSIDCKFGNLFAGTIEQAKKITVQFGKAISTIEALQNGKVVVQFCKVRINKLAGEIVADFNQAHGVWLRVDNSLKKLDMSNSFSEVQLEIPRNGNALLKITTNYTRFVNASSFASIKDNEEERFNFRRDFEVKAGNGSTPINIKNNFGKLTLTHDL